MAAWLKLATYLRMYVGWFAPYSQVCSALIACKENFWHVENGSTPRIYSFPHFPYFPFLLLDQPLPDLLLRPCMHVCMYTYFRCRTCLCVHVSCIRWVRATRAYIRTMPYDVASHCATVAQRHRYSGAMSPHKTASSANWFICARHTLHYVYS